jgi:hypothetical protein
VCKFGDLFTTTTLTQPFMNFVPAPSCAPRAISMPESHIDESPVNELPASKLHSAIRHTKESLA